MSIVKKADVDMLKISHFDDSMNTDRPLIHDYLKLIGLLNNFIREQMKVPSELLLQRLPRE